MPIRTKPFRDITLADVEDLIARGIAEGQELEYKQDLELSDRGKIEFLKDVTAMANAEGGTIVYGVVEGETDERGIPVRIAGLRIDPDTIGLALATLISDGLDERLSGVLHRALQVGDGTHVYVVRVPSSPLAPHMISLRSSGPRFYRRSNAANIPMNMRQVKEAVMRRSTAYERAGELVQQRLEILRARAERRTQNAYGQPVTGRAQVVLHVVPLFPHSGGWGFGDPDVDTRLRRVPPLGAREPYREWRHSLVGYGSEFRGTAHVLFLRTGAVEFQRYDPLDVRTRPETDVRLLPAYTVERSVRDALRQCAALSADGLLPMPVLIQLAVLGVEGTRLHGAPRADTDERPIEDDEVVLTAVIINSWDELPGAERALFDEMWQAWGRPRSWNYDADGRAIEYDDLGNRYSRP